MKQLSRSLSHALALDLSFALSLGLVLCLDLFLQFPHCFHAFNLFLDLFLARSLSQTFLIFLALALSICLALFCTTSQALSFVLTEGLSINFNLSLCSPPARISLTSPPCSTLSRSLLSSLPLPDLVP
ncbi:hypothetical protein J6590_053745 [Homalodisca vitripennis]|nr:hypothetical protein J6590_053745 [Homalodisca vitripennis]